MEFTVNICYEDVYDDLDEVNPGNLVAIIPTKMALTLVSHYTGQIHTMEKNSKIQLKFIADWVGRFDQKTLVKINAFIKRVNEEYAGSFNFINNVSSLYLIECLLENHNDLPSTENLTVEQEENLFKAYLFFSSKWTKLQTDGSFKYKEVSIAYMTLVMMLPFSELFEFKDFRIQFLKAIYFFKFCEGNEVFTQYLAAFLAAKEVKSWNEYLFNLASTYVTLLQHGDLKTVLQFSAAESRVFNSLLNFCVNIQEFNSAPDFLSLRTNPVYRIEKNELLFLNINFLIDKIYQAIIFDFADVLIRGGLTYNGRVITSKPQFIGIFGDEFMEPGLFNKVMQNTFKQKDYIHFSGDKLKQRFGDGVPDYMILDNRKLYVFELKNTFFSAPVKYSFDIDAIKGELEKKFVKNEGGKPKGVTQLVNFVEDISKGRYNAILDADTKYIIYPIIVTTDYTFILPVLGSYVAGRYDQILKDRKLNYLTQKLTLMDLDSLIKFQDLFIAKKLTMNHVLQDYQLYLRQGKTELDKSLSFHRYIHEKTFSIKYDTPKMFFDEIQNLFDNMQE